MFKKYLLLGTAVVFLTGCSFSGIKKSIKKILPASSTEQLILEKISNNAPTLSLGEIISYDWEYIRFIRPYQIKKMYGQTLNQKDDTACQWVILGKEKKTQTDSVLEIFSIQRETLDCTNLPDKTFGRNDAIFLIRDGQLKERKKFKR